MSGGETRTVEVKMRDADELVERLGKVLEEVASKFDVWMPPKPHPERILRVELGEVIDATDAAKIVLALADNLDKIKKLWDRGFERIAISSQFGGYDVLLKMGSMWANLTVFPFLASLCNELYDFEIDKIVEVDTRYANVWCEIATILDEDGHTTNAWCGVSIDLRKVPRDYRVLKRLFKGLELAARVAAARMCKLFDRV